MSSSPSSSSPSSSSSSSSSPMPDSPTPGGEEGSLLTLGSTARALSAPREASTRLQAQTATTITTQPRGGVSLRLKNGTQAAGSSPRPSPLPPPSPLVDGKPK
ncbi:unnamed protein product [Cutaneotrichosporon oleaginosum]